MSFEDEIRRAVREELAPLRAELAEVRRQLQAQSPDDILDFDGAALFLGKRNPDGTPNGNALRSFMQRHPVPHEKVGKRLRFKRSVLEAWLRDRPKVRRRLGLDSTSGTART